MLDNSRHLTRKSFHLRHENRREKEEKEGGHEKYLVSSQFGLGGEALSYLSLYICARFVENRKKFFKTFHENDYYRGVLDQKTNIFCKNIQMILHQVPEIKAIKCFSYKINLLLKL